MLTAYISPLQQDPDSPEFIPASSGFFSSRSDRRRSIAASTVDTNLAVEQFPKQTRSRRDSLRKKLAGPRENAKRFLRLGAPPINIPHSSLSPPLTTAPATTPRTSTTTNHYHTRAMSRTTRPRPVSEIILSPNEAQMLVSAAAAGRMRSDSSSTVSMTRPPASAPDTPPVSDTPAPFPSLRNEKIVATGSGIAVGIALTEPVLFLQGYDQNDLSTKKSAILRGQLHLKITKSVKIKKISICFRGHAQTDWPDGIPPKKIHFHDKKDLVTHGVMYFNHGDTALMQNDYGAHFYQHAKPIPSVTGKDGSMTTTRELFSKSGSSTSLHHHQPTAKELKGLSLQANHSHSRSFGKNELPTSNHSHPQRNYRLFPVGDYVYNFEFPIDGSLPETIKTDLGFVRYDLEAIVERSGAFRPNLLGTLEVPVIRTPAEGSLEQVEPIAISRNWEDQLHYDIVISGKSFPLGSQVPIAFKLTPLAKVECHRIKVYVTENIQHWTSDKSVHRLQPAKKVLLFEKRADSASVSTYPGSSMRVTAGGGIDWDHRAAAARGEEIIDRNRTNLLGNLASDSGIGPTEMEFNVQLPSCQEMKNRDESHRLHFDTTYENIQINHWIKIVLRLSRLDERDPGKRRHFEISIDSPFHLLSCKATQANIFLPAYTSPNSDPVPPAQEYECGCPGAALISRNNSSSQLIASDREDPPAVSRSFTNGSGGLARPPQVHLAHEASNDRVPRPMHLLRTPSFAPPPFEDVPPPPPLITPPPEYNSIVGDNDRETVLQDYFSRLSFYEEHEDEDERGRGRVDVPLTPGGRVNRSMDVPREWIRLGEPALP
ncbi:arrestin family protein [Aspergillus clavatus NRRL 1]|uniref:Arrestin domain protein n=1 Tax=Aspergillus clavatus (strain ATCC 1007 / CBS 513.65 / DSM 816 / NCTC 3887 / NRRL 1 / QM 1276 / 107) TaxID=344612 RepID=A1CPS1_ASPCL|nr:arrestin domain protein [Aspergillus clavatus NRRL 1]EAW07642.1 arrestin domain protein [Aspergillus clavatus NRRL 1]